MSAQPDKPDNNIPAVRVFHLQGGCRAHDQSPHLIRIVPIASNGMSASFQTPSFQASYAILHSAGFRVLGVDFYTEQEQLQWLRLPDWRVYHRIGATSWPSAEQADKWSRIAHGAFKAGKGVLWDVASRISYQLRACAWRFREISESYHDILVSAIKPEPMKDGTRFASGLTWLGYLSLQGFFVDACVLRDYLAEYWALRLVEYDGLTFKSKITRMAALKKHYLEAHTLDTKIAQKLKADTDRGGWLFQLGAYRDLVVHCAPLASADKKLYALRMSLPLDAKTTLPAIKLPIPSTPSEIMKGRSSGSHFRDPQMNYARFVNALENPAVAPDGMEYAHLSLEHLGALAAELAATSPVQPEIPTLTEKDIIDLKVV
jgi:hypothetical protein